MNSVQSGFGITALAEGLKSCANLEELNVTDNKLRTSDIDILVSGLEFCGALRELNITRGNHLTQTDLRRLSSVTVLK